MSKIKFYKKKKKKIDYLNKVYTGVNYGNAYFNDEKFARFPLWIANWGVSKPGIPGKWKSYVYW